MIDCILFYAVSAILQPYSGGTSVKPIKRTEVLKIHLQSCKPFLVLPFMHLLQQAT